MTQKLEAAFFVCPDSPLVLRTGRPFGAADDGGGAGTQLFPMPGTVAGAFRTAWCEASGHWPAELGEARLHPLHVRGPLRCSWREGNPALLWFAVPADAMRSVNEAPARRSIHPILPLSSKHADTDCDLPFGLLPLLTDVKSAVEPLFGWWDAHTMTRWLLALGNGPTAGPLVRDLRTHVVIDRATLSARTGGLFFSEGIDFTSPAERVNEEQGYFVCAEAPEILEGRPVRLALVDGRRGRVGADGRTAHYRTLTGTADGEKCPDGVADALDALRPGDRLRLVLATPACYLRNGWFPDGLKPTGPVDSRESRIRGELVGATGWTFELEAAAVNRHLCHAGMALGRDGGRPIAKQLKRLVPAGSVYWLRVLERTSAAKSLSDLWLRSTCRVEHARDGYGLALWGNA